MSYQLPDHPTVPHKALVRIEATVYEMLPTGECGRAVHRIENALVAIDGQDRASAIRRLNEKLEALKQ